MHTVTQLQKLWILWKMEEKGSVPKTNPKGVIPVFKRE